MGTVAAVTATTVSSKVMGAVIEIGVADGARFAAGEVLVAIDPRQAQARLDQAQAAFSRTVQAREAALSALQGARAADRLAASTLARYRLLQTEQTVSPQEFDEVANRAQEAAAGRRQAEALARAAQDQARQAEGAMRDARVMFQDTRLSLPFEGIVVRRLVEPGDLAMPGTPLLLVEQLSGHRAEVAVPEHLSDKIEMRQEVMVTIPALQNRQVAGRVETIEPAVDPATRTIRVKLALPAVEALRSGMFLQVLIPVGREEMLWIPSTAVVHEGQLTGVYLVDAESVARFRLIRTAGTEDGRIQVVAGLKGGERIVAALSPQVSDGIRVEAAP